MLVEITIPVFNEERDLPVCGLVRMRLAGFRQKL